MQHRLHWRWRELYWYVKVHAIVCSIGLIIISFFVSLFIDINECIMDVCSVNAECANTEGSYECQCHAGFNTDGQICTGQCS